MAEPENGRQSAQGEGIAQACGPGASASVVTHHHHYPAESPAPTWPRPWNFSGYIAEKRRGFVGRAWLFDEVRDWYTDRDGTQALLVCADFGVGKSAFAAKLATEAHGLRIAAYHFCHHDSIETLNPATFVRSVAAQFADSLPEYRWVVDGDPPASRWLDNAQLDPASAFERAVVGPLHAIKPPDAPQVLLVDALDEALDFALTSGGSRPATIVRLLANQANHLPAWLRMLTTTRRIQEVLQPVQNAFRRVTLLDGEDARNLADIRDYVLGRCTGLALSRVLEQGNRSASELAAFLSDAKQSRGKFLYAVRVLNDVESGLLPPDRLNELPPGMDGFYLDAFERRFPEHEDYAPVGALLGVLCVQREPLSRTDLAAILGTSEKEVGKLLKRLEDFLRISAKRYAFDHLSLAQWLSEENEDGFPRAGRFSVEPEAANRLIVAWARRDLAADRAYQSAYLARHLGAYLSPSERKAHFSKLLLDFRWLDARLRAAGIAALLADWADVDETSALNALGRAIGQGAHVLGHDGDDWTGADFLASQILGRLQSRAEPDLHCVLAQSAEHLARNGGWRPLTDSLRANEALLRTFETESWNSALAVLADGRLASASSATIRVWNTVSGDCEAVFEGHTDRIFALAILANGRIASKSMDHTIRVWNPASGICEVKLEEFADCVSMERPLGAGGLTPLPDGRLASAAGSTINLWNSSTGVCEKTLVGHRVDVSKLVVLSDGRLASASPDELRLWNTASGGCEAVFKGHCRSISALVTLGDGRLALASTDDAIRLWNLEKGMCEAMLGRPSDAVSALAVMANGQLAAGSIDGTIRLWNPKNGECAATLEGHTGYVFALAVLGEGRLASGAGDGTIRLWNPTSRVREAPCEGHTDWVDRLAVLADGRFASGSTDATIRLWNPASGMCEAVLTGHTGSIVALTMLTDGRLASASDDGEIKLWNLTNGLCDATLEEYAGALMRLVDGRLAVAGSWENKIVLWNPVSGARAATLEGHTRSIETLTLLTDGRLASGSKDGTIKLWNPASCACEATLEGHSDRVSALAVLTDGRLASASDDYTIKLWDTANSVCEATLEEHTGYVSALAVLADGQLASGSWDGTIRIWGVRNGRWTGTVRFVADARILALDFAGTAGVLAAGDANGRVHFLKVA